MVKRGPRRLKIGVQSRFGPNSTVEFEAVFQKKIGVAYCIIGLAKIFGAKSAEPYSGVWVKG